MALEQPQGGEMEDAVGAVERRLQDVGLEDVAADVEDPHARILERVGQVLGAAADEIVVDDDLAARPRAAADRPCASRSGRRRRLRTSLLPSSRMFVFHLRMLVSHTCRAKGKALVKAGEMALSTCVEVGSSLDEEIGDQIAALRGRASGRGCRPCRRAADVPAAAAAAAAAPPRRTSASK